MKLRTLVNLFNMKNLVIRQIQSLAPRYCQRCSANFYNFSNIEKRSLQDFILYRFNTAIKTKNSLLRFETIGLKYQERCLSELNAVDDFLHQVLKESEIHSIIDLTNLIHFKSCFVEDSILCLDLRAVAAKTVHLGNLTSNDVLLSRLLKEAEFNCKFPKILLLHKCSKTSKFHILICKHFFNGYDDLLCIYMSLMLHGYPRIITKDSFRDHLHAANEFSQSFIQYQSFGKEFRLLAENTRRCDIESNQGKHIFSQVNTETNVHHYVTQNCIYYCTKVNDSDLSANRSTL